MFQAVVSNPGALRHRWAPVVVPFTVLLAGCGGSQPTAAGPTVTVTSFVTVTATSPPSGAQSPTTPASPPPPTPSATPRVLSGNSDGLYLHVVSVTRKPSITYSGNTISDVTPDGKDVTIKAKGGSYYLYVKMTGKNGTKHPIDLTCGYPLKIAAYDTTDAEYTPIESLAQIKGNPGCNDQTQPGQTFRETFIFLMPKDSKPAQLRWASISPELEQGPVATIDL